MAIKAERQVSIHLPRLFLTVVINIYIIILAESNKPKNAVVAESADALDSGSSRGFLVQVQVLSSAS